VPDLPAAHPSTGVRFVVSVTPADVGSRVSVRRRVGPRACSDVVGALLSYRDGVLVVATRRGEVRVPARDVVAARTVPPAPARRRR